MLLVAPCRKKSCSRTELVKWHLIWRRRRKKPRTLESWRTSRKWWWLISRVRVAAFHVKSHCFLCFCFECSFTALSWLSFTGGIGGTVWNSIIIKYFYKRNPFVVATNLGYSFEMYHTASHQMLLELPISLFKPQESSPRTLLLNLKWFLGSDCVLFFFFLLV